MPNRYHELVVQGRRGELMGFVEGYVRGRGIERPIVNAEEEGFNCQPFRERIEDLLHPAMDILHLLVPVEAVEMIRHALEHETPADLEVEIRAERVVLAARFAFSFEIHSPPHAERVKERFDNLPRGVRLVVDEEFREERYEQGRGIEVYAPVHDYTFAGSGVIEGDVDGVLAVYRFCRDEDLVHERPAELIGQETD